MGEERERETDRKRKGIINKLETSLIIIKITHFAGDIGAVEDADD